MKIDISRAIEIMEDYDFSVFLYDDNMMELETWTNAGVNMLIHLDKTTMMEDLYYYIRNFDAEEEVLLYAECMEYMDNIGLRGGLEDFDEYIQRVEDMCRKLSEEFED